MGFSMKDLGIAFSMCMYACTCVPVYSKDFIHGELWPLPLTTVR